MPSSKKQSIESRTRSSAVIFPKTRGGHIFLIACSICAIFICAFLSLLIFLGSCAAGFEGSVLFALFLFVLSIAFLFFSVACGVFAFANIAALRKCRGRKPSPFVKPRWLSVVRRTLLVILIIWVVSQVLGIFLIFLFKLG